MISSVERKRERARERYAEQSAAFATRRELLLIEQGFMCASCGAPIRNADEWCADHDHRCCPGQAIYSCGECTRGVICRACNTVLGAWRDDPIALRERAVELDLQAYRARCAAHYLDRDGDAAPVCVQLKKSRRRS